MEPQLAYSANDDLCREPADTFELGPDVPGRVMVPGGGDSVQRVLRSAAGGATTEERSLVRGTDA